MRLHAFLRPDGSMHVVAECLRDGASPGRDWRDLGSGEVELADLSQELVLGMGLEAEADAGLRDACIIRQAIDRPA